MGVQQEEKGGVKEGAGAVVGAEWCAAGEEVLRLWQPACSRVSHASRLPAADHHDNVDNMEADLFSIVNPRWFSFRCCNLLLRHDSLPLLSSTRKCLSLKKETCVYRGEANSHEGAPLFTVRLASLLQYSTNLHVFLEKPSGDSLPTKATNPVPDYKVKASWFKNDLTIMRNDGAVVAKAKHKCTFSSIFLCKPSYKIVVHEGVDKAFVTMLVAIQDKLRNRIQGTGGGGP
ncbi:hypothetical protein L7F22_061289 [Adiantum nelumboides]|nr:hypothetical protein [Adiantum nelumboides]